MKTLKLAFALVFVYLFANCINLLNQEVRLQNYQAQLDKDMQQALAQQQQLQEDLQLYKTPEGVEELARKRLGYFKKGEIPLRVIEATPQTPMAETVDESLDLPVQGETLNTPIQ